MNFSKESEELMPFFINNVRDFSFENNDSKENKKSQKNKLFDDFLSKFVDNIRYAEKYIKNHKSSIQKTTIKISKNGNTRSQHFKSNYLIPNEYLMHIKEHAYVILQYKFTYLNRTFTINNYLLNQDDVKKIHIYDTEMERMFMWLIIVSKKNKETKCSRNLVTNIYRTNFKKKIPSDHVVILSNKHVNSAFTTSCTENGEIVIYRQEELFKVFIHETFHVFGLDFSDSNNMQLHNKFKKIFQIKSDFNVYEAYTEFWARTINSIFTGFFIYGSQKSKEQTIIYAKICIHLEQMYALHQTVKILNFVGLEYTDLYKMDDTSKIKRENLYREDTNVFSYYIITMLLLIHIKDFIYWCDRNNERKCIFKFNSDIKTKNLFFIFIKERYGSEFVLNNISKMKKFIINIYQGKMFEEKKILFNNLRMSLCEFV